MNGLAPTWALSAQAIHVAEGPVLQACPGVHLRVMPGMALGLPVAPLVVRRFNRGCAAEAGEPTDVVWTDSAGKRLLPEFEFGEKTGPVTAWLPAEPGNPVIWAGVEMDANDGESRVEAFVSGPHGPGMVAAAERFPWQVAATGIDRVVLRGRGLVRGIRVIRAQSIPPGEAPEVGRLALPISEGLRYRGELEPEEALEQARRRVILGAPRRVGLHDQPAASEPEACDETNPDEEMARVEFLWKAQVGEMTTALIETDEPPRALRMPEQTLTGTDTLVEARAKLPALAGLLQAALDPGVARFLGLADCDPDPEVGLEGELVLYLVQGSWALQIDAFDPRIGWLERSSAEGGFGSTGSLPPWVEEAGLPVVNLWTVAAVVLGSEPAPPPVPLATGSEDLGWGNDPPPAARRRVALGLSGLAPGASVALARTSEPAQGLNPRLSDLGGPDRAVPIACGVPAETGPAAGADASGQGEVFDNEAPAEAVSYTVAQADWFGRWSGWGKGKAEPGLRPRRPLPVLDAVFVPPQNPGEEGALEVRCQQPRDVDLAPGSFPLRRLRLEAKLDRGPAIQVFEVKAEQGSAPVGETPPPLFASLPVPGLEPSENRGLSVRGAWLDSSEAEPEGRDWSPPTGAVASDPRAAPPLVLPNELTYASRPDALGRSRVRLRWPAADPPTGYRVYHSDETTLLRRLAEIGKDTKDPARAARAREALDDLKGRRGAPDRAAAFKQYTDLLDRAGFELLTAAPLQKLGNEKELSHEHDLSGSLDVLAFYRVVPVSGLGAEADFTACSLLPRGVPNTPAPPTPSLSAAVDPDDAAKVRLEVSVPAGAARPVTVRLRRSRVGGGDPLAMPVVAVSQPGSWDPAVLTDDGAGPWGATPFVAWATYAWRVEVQGGREPGKGPAGAWSRPSAPVSLRIVPPSPPGAPEPGGAEATENGVEVRFSVGEPLDGGSAGSYAIELYREGPAGAGSGAVGEFDPAAIRQPDGSYLALDRVIAPGSTYLVQIVDPLGRRGPRTPVATL